MNNVRGSLTRKFVVPTALGVLAACALMVGVLGFLLVGRENSLTSSRAQAQSRLLIQSLTFAMSNGVTDVGPIEKSLKGFEGIDEFRLVPQDGMSKADHPAPDAVEQEVFATGKAYTGFESPKTEGGNRLIRVTEPVKANDTCSLCHADSEAGKVVAVTSMFLSTDDSARFIATFTFQAAGLTLVAILVLMGVVLGTLRLVVLRPLGRMRDLVADIAHGEGDLTKRVSITSKDEVGEVAGLVNIFVDQTQDVVLGIRRFAVLNTGNAEALGEKAVRTRGSVSEANVSIESTRKRFAELSAESAAVSASTSGILAGITALSARIEEQSKAVSQSSSAIGQMSASVENVARVTERKQASANELVEVTRRGGEKVGVVNAEITEVSKSVKDISSAINLINSIAAQTNLLSMNAAIEAAHAGQYGAGFAVVAEEIRHLAESSATNSKAVTAVLKRIIGQIEKALAASRDSSGALVRIGEEVAELVQAFNEIAAGTRELAEGGRSILEASESLLAVTGGIRGDSVEMSREAEAIGEAESRIARIAASSKEAVDEVARRAAEIDADIAGIASLSEKGRDLGRKLGEAVGRFTVREHEEGPQVRED